MYQTDFIRRISESAGKFSWFLGAGASQSSGLPTANDIVWDLKRRYFCSEEHQDISSNDLQNLAVREKIQSFMISRGFPIAGDQHEYSRCFELIFSGDYERQRRYLRAILSEKNLGLTLGPRILAAFIACGFTRAVFTTNFDTVVERAVAEVSGQDIAPFHLEGSYAAKEALNNDEFPIYCKLHGDFRYQSLKNLEKDLQTQNVELGECLINACNRFGLIVAGYSGRDESVMNLFAKALEGNNPFPHGLFWTGLKGRQPLETVQNLLKSARAKGIKAELVEVETFDSMLSRLWKQLPDKAPELIKKVGRFSALVVNIPLPLPGRGNPILRTNALPIVRLPDKCLELIFDTEKDWKYLQAAESASQDRILCTKGKSILAWGCEESIRRSFGSSLKSISPIAITELIDNLSINLYLKTFLEKALSIGLIRGKPLLYRTWRGGSALIIDRYSVDAAMPADLVTCVGNLYGQVVGQLTTPTDDNPEREQVWWSEALQIDLDEVNGSFWLTLKPDVWIWPKRERKEATEFLDKRCGGRFNKQADQLLSAWIKLLLPSDVRGANHNFLPFDNDESPENPLFIINGRTAFTRRSAG